MKTGCVLEYEGHCGRSDWRLLKEEIGCGFNPGPGDMILSSFTGVSKTRRPPGWPPPPPAPPPTPSPPPGALLYVTHPGAATLFNHPCHSTLHDVRQNLFRYLLSLVKADRCLQNKSNLFLPRQRSSVWFWRGAFLPRDRRDALSLGLINLKTTLPHPPLPLHARLGVPI